MKKGSKDFIKQVDIEKSKMNIQRFKGPGRDESRGVMEYDS